MERRVGFLAVVGVLLACVAWAGLPKSAGRSIGLADASGRGAFNVGPATAKVDPAPGGEALRLEYNLPPGSAAGLWTKGFPEGFEPGIVDVVRIDARPVGKAAGEVSAKLEIKGSGGVQSIPLEVREGQVVPIRWASVGRVAEVVVSVEPKGGTAPISGSIDVSVRFEALPWATKAANLPTAKLAGVIGVALLVGLLARLIPGGRREGGFGGLSRDLVQGAGSALIVAVGVAIYDLGERVGLEAGWWCLGLAVAGPLVVEWWTYGLVGRHLTPGEALGHALVIGLLGATTSPLGIAQAPATWSQALLLSQASAATVAVIYLSAIAWSLSSRGRPLDGSTGGLIVGTPFAFGALVLLSCGGLMGQIGGWVVGGLDVPILRGMLGRSLVLFGFNEAATLALTLATGRRPSRSIALHSLLALIAFNAAGLGVWVADLGSGEAVAAWPPWARPLAVVGSTMISQGVLWGEVYLITGLGLDALRGAAPSRDSALGNYKQGLIKGAIFSGVYMAILQGLGLLGDVPGLVELARRAPIVLAVPFGMVAFPLAKTMIETFDGSSGFFRRVGNGYSSPVLYLRGGLVGLGVGLALMVDLPARSIPVRAAFGFLFGAAAYAMVNAGMDLFDRSRGRARVLPGRAYLVQGLVGGFIGAALAFYFDAAQLGVVIAKFHRYLELGVPVTAYGVTPLVSKWGFVNLGTTTGGVKLLFDEALAGAIEWSVPAWLFVINNRFLAAFFQREAAPVRSLFSRDGMVGLTQNMIQVFRWGLWMSPIVKSFLRSMGEPTWYNQDGAIRTLVAIAHDATESQDAFRTWSIDVFISVLAYDLMRVLIWVDHMGLRVATLVNLSFLGMDRLDQRLARFLRPASTARCLPEAVKRFMTWAPLLIPFYIPKDRNWDVAWNTAEQVRAANPGGLSGRVLGLPLDRQMLLLAGFVGVTTAGFSIKRRLSGRSGRVLPASWTLRNPEYAVELKSTGEMVGRVLSNGFDLTRRSYDGLDPAGRALYLVEVDPAGTPLHSWPILGNFPGGDASRFGESGETLVVDRDGDDLTMRLEIQLPGPLDPAELWTVTVDNPTGSTRRFQLVPYLEWVLNLPDADRGHTQYARLFPEMEYAPGLHAVLAWDKHAKAMGFLASEATPGGFLTSRIDFIGRARGLRSPRVLETLDFDRSGQADSHPTFDPIASLEVPLTVAPRSSQSVRFLVGYATDKTHAIALIARHLAIPGASGVSPAHVRKAVHSIGHGEVPPGTPQPYAEFLDDGRTLRVLTPFTTRPYDHAMSNALGHVVAVTNRGLSTTMSGNSQQNRVTPDWPDIVTREAPSEAFYLYDPATSEWFSPTYHPLNDPEAAYVSRFGVDGTATFLMARGEIETELTVFVPPDVPAGVYLLTVRNRSRHPRHLRLASYFQVVLAAQPEAAGPLQVRRDRESGALFFENPRNTFREGPAFAATSIQPEWIETDRGRFFGPGRDVTRPALVERGAVDPASIPDDRPIAGFVGTLQLPSNGEETVVVLLGQADDRGKAERVIRRYRDVANARADLEATRKWWLGLMDTVRVETASPEFDRYLDWLKYQALAERIWARRGFYQASGAFGFRDQLQDAVNLIWMDPSLARRQIVLHGSQQFIEGDVVHWFHRKQDGRTGFAARTHASDNLLWLAWAVVDYVEATGDESVLDERTTYLTSEIPFEPLPAGKHGMGFDPLRSSRDDTIYRHCLRSVDLVLDYKMGSHRLPLIGTGDWNDGLDEIGSQGRGESIWLGFFLHYILKRLAGIVGKKDGPGREDHYLARLRDLGEALESTWRDDRYLRAIHDDGTEIGIKGSGVWEIDALTAAWAVMSGINPRRGRVVFDTALAVLEKETTILLGWPPLREDTKPYLGRSSWYPEGVRENGMYCHGVQWLVGAARILSRQFEAEGKHDEARHYAEAAHRLWLKISPIAHVTPGEVETYGGQPNKQAADMVTTFDPGRMIWHGYTGAAGWMFRQAVESVLGLRLVDNAPTHPADQPPLTALGAVRVTRDLGRSPLPAAFGAASPSHSPRPGPRHVAFEPETHST